jgi:hypothetical protein
MIFCLQHGRCSHNFPRCRCENCWTQLTSCPHVVEVSHHYIPNTIFCENCVDEITVWALQPTPHSTHDDTNMPSTSATSNRTALTDNEDDGLAITDNVSDASTIIRETNNLDNNFPGIYNDNSHTFWIHKRHLGRDWKKSIDKIRAILPSLHLLHHAGYIHFFFDLQFHTTTSVNIMHRILDILKADQFSYRHALITLVQITRKDIYLSFCKTAYKPIRIPPGKLTNNIRIRL